MVPERFVLAERRAWEPLLWPLARPPLLLSLSVSGLSQLGLRDEFDRDRVVQS